MNRLQKVISSFTLTEKVIFYFLTGIFAISAFSIIWEVNQSFMVEIPADGGSITEGELGYPRYINPLLPITDSGRDLSALIYSGLMKTDDNGNLIPDLAKSYDVSNDGLSYTFVLKDDLLFQDGIPVTADDVIFTINTAKNPDLKSPVAANWAGVAVTKIDDKTIKFVLQKPYGPFLQNTTLGILPKHLWQNISADEFAFTNYNVEPVGSGPYEIKSIKRDSDGLPQYYSLKPFNRYAGSRAHISEIVIRFYTDVKSLHDAFNQGIISSMNSVSPAEANQLKDHTDVSIVTAPLQRVFGVFFNQNQSRVLLNKEVRQALNIAVNRQDIVSKVLNTYGSPIDGPFPPNNLSGDKGLRETPTTTDVRIATAKNILTKAGWSLNKNGIMEKKTKKDTQTLSFSISTANSPDLTQAANLLKDQWSAIGADVTVKVFEIGDLNQNIIRTRKYDALLFGEIIDSGNDLFPFWDSSQRNDPGLNIAEYTNSKADKFLEDARTTNDPVKLSTDWIGFEQEIYNDIPATFLYSPDFIYVVPKNLKGVDLGQVATPSDRFSGVNTWYLNTDKVWKFFANQ